MCLFWKRGLKKKEKYSVSHCMLDFRRLFFHRKNMFSLTFFFPSSSFCQKFVAERLFTCSSSVRLSTSWLYVRKSATSQYIFGREKGRKVKLQLLQRIFFSRSMSTSIKLYWSWVMIGCFTFESSISRSMAWCYSIWWKTWFFSFTPDF